MPRVPKSKNDGDIVDYVQAELAKVADESKAPEMQAYMKTDMPFYGVQKPDRLPIIRGMKANFRPASRSEYEQTIRRLWDLPYREEKYLALNYACEFVSLAEPKTLVLFEALVREGSWWDFVDVIAGHLVGAIYLKYRDEIEQHMDRWIVDDDFWIRRTAILSQMKHKKSTDAKRLFAYCLAQAGEKEFFIRKAIGWALREYSYAEPAAVKKFLLANKNRLSPLSFKEGAKHLVKVGVMDA
ncbi:DNA alkylation repair protein [Candidatus Obscuribacterales bacterium]|nr:DNA alkylation repair protein [Candidatus Obscuribacterales bacterium]